MADPVWFWQRIVSPHMAGLAEALATAGRKVTYVAEQEMSAERSAQGWQAPELGKVKLRFAASAEAIKEAVRATPANSIHICQGLRGNGFVGLAQEALAARGLRQWVIMETVDDAGWRGLLKRIEYRRLIGQWQPLLQGILATGHATPHWLIKQGMPAERVFPFAYFLPDKKPVVAQLPDPNTAFRFLFVGQFIERKRIDLLLSALESLTDKNFELAIVGSGPLENTLKETANKKLAGHVRWLGRRPLAKIPALMAEADCLVLPSRHDGWGAVISEALMAGTPVLCSDSCGAALAVRASGVGGVFPAGDKYALGKLVDVALTRGHQAPDQRGQLANWAQCLGAAQGAAYLDKILVDRQGRTGRRRPVAPWAVSKGSIKT